MDVRTTFLHGNLEERIYMRQPEGFENKDPNLVCLLNKSLYGLKQAHRQWNIRFHEFMTKIKYHKSKFDPYIYTNGKIFLLLYVDDILLIGKDRSEIDMLKRQLHSEFEMKDLGEAKKILGIEIKKKRPGRITLSQKQYLSKVLDRFNMNKAKPISTPLAPHFKLTKDQSPKTETERVYMDKVPYASCVGSLIYAMVCTRPNLAQAMSIVSRLISNPGEPHWDALKWIMRYVKGSIDIGLIYDQKMSNIDLVIGYVDFRLCKVFRY